MKAIEIREKVLDKNYPNVATSYSNLSLIYFAAKDYENAYVYCERAVNIMAFKFPGGYPELDKMADNLRVIQAYLHPTE